MGFRKINGQWERKGHEIRVEEVRDEDVPGPSTAGPSTAGPSGPSIPSPPLAPSGPFAESVGFSDRQLDQLRALLDERDSVLRDEVRQLSGKLDLVVSILSSSADSLSSELRKIFERLEGIAEGSRTYLDATGQLRRDIDFAITQIEELLGNFHRSQKDDIMELIGHFKRLIYKST